jgi:hypothetical protein
MAASERESTGGVRPAEPSAMAGLTGLKETRGAGADSTTSHFFHAAVAPRCDFPSADRQLHPAPSFRHSGMGGKCDGLFLPRDVLARGCQVHFPSRRSNYSVSRNVQQPRGVSQLMFPLPRLRADNEPMIRMTLRWQQTLCLSFKSSASTSTSTSFSASIIVRHREKNIVATRCQSWSLCLVQKMTFSVPHGPSSPVQLHASFRPSRKTNFVLSR